ncbi:adenylate/guanylate cyclase domain-containing protein [Polaromonas sp.]|uniref:adenylate/guanylate cyclase domain-containing protein n=1 Tax=Polaromonas sp. TaxID=1869339 RepID=UPI0017BA1F5B|nr:adenylate/guanylate cyclase domain-containing protein [Polaromonas sp.]NMM06780.1 adenylate/guanylate cyclase domain-containing protein [Polaromonas sp.]
MLELTVVFADLTGSTGVFESLGNAKATQAITRLTQWIGEVCKARDGRVVKNLGDGVLMVFTKNLSAIEAVTEMQRVHQDRIRNWPEQLKMRLQVGMARGDIVEQDGDCFGDAVNVASRLSDLSGPEQILATDSVIRELGYDSMVRFRCLGAMDIRGRSEACVVHRIEWQSDIMSAFLTQPASLTPLPVATPAAPPATIRLSWLDSYAVYTSDRLPIFLGRDKASQFVVQDPRVSRWHSKISWRAGKYYLEDVSSYGTWVRFSDNPVIVALRRQECLLLQEGEIALGASFDDFTAPIVSFNFDAACLGANGSNFSGAAD